MGLETLADVEVKGNILHMNKHSYVVFMQVSTVWNTCSQHRGANASRFQGPG